MKLYGSLENRLEENKMFCDEIKVGTLATEYFYSDRKPYEVTKVINQKHIFIRMLDHKPAGEPMSNEWELTSNPKNSEIELVYRYNHWCKVSTWTSEKLEKAIIVSCKVIEALKTKSEFKTYSKINISFGKADYYFDYEF